VRGSVGIEFDPEAPPHPRSAPLVSWHLRAMKTSPRLRGEE
jgi:hypothetical protein